MPSTIRVKHNESVQLVTYYCHQCRQQILFLSPLGRCSECHSEFVEEKVEDDSRISTHAHTHQTSSQSLENKSNATPTKQNKLLEKSAENCSICLEALAEQPKKLSCGHNFHSHCIDPWLTTNITCPLCRKKVAKPKLLVGNVGSGVTRHLIEYTIIQSMMRPLLMPEIRVSRRDLFAVTNAERNQMLRNHRRELLANTGRVLRTRSQSRP